MEGEQPYLGDILTMVINHLLYLKVGWASKPVKNSIGRYYYFCPTTLRTLGKSKPMVFSWSSRMPRFYSKKTAPVKHLTKHMFFCMPEGFLLAGLPTKRGTQKLIKNFPNKLSGIHIFPILSQAYGSFVGISHQTPLGTIIQPRELKQVEEAELVGVAQRRPLNTCKTAHSLGVSHLVCWNFCKWLFW